MIIRNWRHIEPWASPKLHGHGIDWRIFSQIGLEANDVNRVNPNTAVCLKTIRFLSFAKLQPGGSYPAHVNNVGSQQTEEIYYFITGSGIIRSGENDIRRISGGDIFYTPGGQIHALMNDGNGMMDFIAWNANVTEKEVRAGVVTNWNDCKPVLWHDKGI
jgi:mannose-6-phosphate isomerase-like protein (cupin superfamily)